jgi:hypothetical protein
MPAPIPLTDEDIEGVMRAGFLRSRRDTTANDVLWFSHPMVGPMSQWVLSFRKDIVASIKRTKFKEVSEREMEKKKLPSPLGWRFHFWDCIGSGLVVKCESPGGAFYRLAPGGTTA